MMVYKLSVKSKIYTIVFNIKYVYVVLINIRLQLKCTPNNYSYFKPFINVAMLD